MVLLADGNSEIGAQVRSNSIIRYILISTMGSLVFLLQCNIS